MAGVAHEINNPLAFVSNNVAVLERDLNDLIALIGLYRQFDGRMTPAARGLEAQIDQVSEQLDLDYTLDNLPQLIERTREGLRRIERIVKDLRLFARVDEGEWNEVDLNPGIESSVNMVQGYARKRGVRAGDGARAAAPGPLPRRRGSTRSIVNLLMNAIDACKPEDTVTIRTRAEPETERRAHRSRRYRLRHRSGDPRTDLRPVLHHQADRRGDRPRALDQLRHRRASITAPSTSNPRPAKGSCFHRAAAAASPIRRTSHVACRR